MTEMQLLAAVAEEASSSPQGCRVSFRDWSAADMWTSRFAKIGCSVSVVADARPTLVVKRCQEVA
jgi:hypothetical protein